MAGSTFTVEVNPKIPPKLARLSELANDLWYSWDRPTRTLFARLHPSLWQAVGHNPRLFLRRVDEQRLIEASQDRVFLESFNRVLSAYDTYLLEPMRQSKRVQMEKGETIAYFCAEFGLHESFSIYSGGLGILAGDHCKAASDLGLPFVAVGLLYRQGYFTQQIDADGNQIANYSDMDFEDLPVLPVLRQDGGEVKVQVDFPGRKVSAQLWVARVGHVRLYLLDTDLPENSAQDRSITYRLYGGDINTRIQQEIILGIGGVRALRAAGISPRVWHINEGHAAFQVLERVRELVQEKGLDYGAALEAVAANTVFTTHTPVPAGHDIFSHDLVLQYFRDFIPNLGIDIDTFLHMGRKPDEGEGFNQTALAIRGSRRHNGVSQIHGGVSQKMCQDLWPGVPSEENPITYVTNGVHVPTFLAQEWIAVFDTHLGGEWRNRLMDRDFWVAVEQIPNHVFWSVRQTLKSQMMFTARARIMDQYARNGGSEAHLDRILRYLDPLDPNVLVIGFARRFATYKRATLLFENLERLKKIISNEDRPIVFVFAGKAHPADRPGQDLIRQIHHYSRQPAFEGRLHMVEGYDMALARRLVAGVDVWLNNPEYPMEASGTSGEKAGINAVLNLSVLDGWWGEGFDGDNGWGIKPISSGDPARNRREEAEALYDILEDQVLPLYYDISSHGYSESWVRKAKNSMKTIIPRFNAARMVGEYVERLYKPAAAHCEVLCGEDYKGAKDLSQWKQRVRGSWGGVSMQRIDQGASRMQFGQSFKIELVVELAGLNAEDVRIECLVYRGRKHKDWERRKVYHLACVGKHEDGRRYRFTLDLEPELCGRISYQIRAYPYHNLLTNPYEMGLMIWL